MIEPNITQIAPKVAVGINTAVLEPFAAHITKIILPPVCTGMGGVDTGRQQTAAQTQAQKDT
jgi:hypothetical protein